MCIRDSAEGERRGQVNRWHDGTVLGVRLEGRPHGAGLDAVLVAHGIRLGSVGCTGLFECAVENVAQHRRLLEEGVVAVHRADLCLLYTSDAADERSSVDLGGRRIIKKKRTDSSKCTRDTSDETSQS